jgi:hypothetical protein
LGLFDQSHFTREFKRQFGVTQLAYRHATNGLTHPAASPHAEPATAGNPGIGRRIGGNLRPVDRSRAESSQPRLARDEQDLHE